MAKQEKLIEMSRVFATAERRLRRLRRNVWHALAAWRMSRRAGRISLANLVKLAGADAAPDFLVVGATGGLDGARACLRCVRSILSGALPPGRVTLVAPTIVVEHVRREIVVDRSGGSRTSDKVSFECIDGGLLEAFERGLQSSIHDRIVVCDAAASFAPEASLWLAATSARYPHCKVIYADHECSAGTGTDAQSVGIHYKPAFSWLYLLARDFIEPFVLYDRDALATAVRRVKFRPNALHSARGLLYALALETTRGMTRDEIMHIPHPLSACRDERSLDAEELVAICMADLAARGVEAEVTVMPGSPQVRHFRLRPTIARRVSIIIPTKNSVELVEQCISSLRRTAGYEHFDITVIDHESDEANTQRYLVSEAEAGRLHVLPYAGPFNFAAMNNAAVKKTDGELLLFLNNDVDGFSRGWLAQMVATLELDTRLGAVGALLYFPGGAIQHAGVVLSTKRLCEHISHGAPPDSTGYQGRLHSLQEYSAVTAALLLVRRSAFELINGFDERFPNDYNDVDLCLRLREAGYGVAYSPHASATHWESRTRTARQAGRDLFVERWSVALGRDSFHHAGMSSERRWVAPTLLEARARSRLKLYEVLHGGTQMD